MALGMPRAARYLVNEADLGALHGDLRWLASIFYRECGKKKGREQTLAARVEG